jgi:Xaa-Pro aminopeptidase
VKQYLLDKGLDPEGPGLRRFVRYGGYNHSIGMAVHDGMGTFQGPEEILQEGFVFACDIELSKPDIQLDVRLEDTVVITADGCEVLSSGLPRSIEELESLLGTKK